MTIKTVISMPLAFGVFLVAAFSVAGPTAHADPALVAQYESQMQKYIEGQLAGPLRDLSPDAVPKSPSFGSVGVGLATGAGSAPSQGTAESMGGAFQLRFFGEGTSGSSSLPTDPDALLSALTQKTDEALGNSSGADARLTPAERSAIATDAMAEVSSQYVSYQQAYTAAFNQRAQPRPLYVAEGNAEYNTIGRSSGGGTYTGVKGSLKVGVGFSLKDYGKDGCDIYFLVHGETKGEANYKLEKADKASAAVGVEQGPICQIAHAVTVMVSPSVQAGMMAHANPAGGNAVQTDWLNYAARARVIVDKKLYASVEVSHSPTMTSSKTGPAWEATEFNGTIDAKVVPTWTVGVDWSATSYRDDNSAATGNRAFNDTYVGGHLIRAF